MPRVRAAIVRVNPKTFHSARPYDALALHSRLSCPFSQLGGKGGLVAFYVSAMVFSGVTQNNLPPLVRVSTHPFVDCVCGLVIALLEVDVAVLARCVYGAHFLSVLLIERDLWRFGVLVTFLPTKFAPKSSLCTRTCIRTRARIRISTRTFSIRVIGSTAQ